MVVKKKEEVGKDVKETSEEKEETKDTSTKRIDELEKKLSDMGDTISAQNEFIQGASVVINTLAYTPELRKAFQDQLKKQNVVGEGEGNGKQQEADTEKKTDVPVSKGTDEDITRQVTDVVTSQRENIIDQFEKEHGINSLPDADRKESRRKIETYLNEFGWSVRNIPLKNLKSNLEKAFMGSNIDKLREEGKLEGIAQFRTNEQGSMGTYSSEEGKLGEPKKELTKDQTEFAEKLGVDVEGAKETYLSKDEEYKRKAKAEEKKEG